MPDVIPFNEARLLEDVAYGSEFGHRYKTQIKELKSGVEHRKGLWEQPLGIYSVVYQNLLDGHANLVIDAHHACMGSLIGFRLKDYSDFEAINQVIGFGTGAEQTLQLTKTYTFGTVSRIREIYKPISSTVELFGDGSPLPFSLEETTGLITFTAPGGAEITWSGEFDVPVRFADDEMSWSYDNFCPGKDEYIVNNNVQLVEIRL